MPQDFWDWLGRIATTIVNGLLTAGQLIYGGLIAIGNFFVALGEAIGAWGMALVGTYQAALTAVQEAVQKAADVLMDLVNFFVALVSAAIETRLQPIAQWSSSVNFPRESQGSHVAREYLDGWTGSATSS